MMDEQRAQQQLLVNLAVDTGPVRHGACGFLYGLGKHEIPSANMLAPLKPQVAAQKPEGGQQHPNGDALNVSETFRAGGGREIEIYLQDAYPSWPYDALGLDDFLAKIDAIVHQVIAHPNRTLFSYVPFNEPDQIWYNKTDKKQALLEDWKAVVDRIRSIDPRARIVGPNFARYDSAFYQDFLAYARDHGCLPEVTSWHELNDDFFAGWATRYKDYRRIERSLGIQPREICINEYARKSGDLGIPGKLIQWIARLEQSKVDACLAYWTDAGSLNNLVARDNYNKATGAWWLYRWYGGMTDHTVEVTPPDALSEGLQGLAALDPTHMQARILFGGSAGPVKVVVSGLDGVPGFSSQVHVVVWEAKSTGFAPSDGPAVVFEGDLPVSGGQIALAHPAMIASSAYLLTIMPSGKARGAWKPDRYDATDVDDSVDGSKVIFVVTARDNGFYRVRLRYSAGPLKDQSGARTVGLSLNGEDRIDLRLPATMGWEQWASSAVTLFLTAGINRIAYEIPLSQGSQAVAIDSIEVIPAAGRVDVYQAASPGARRNGAVTLAEMPAAPGGSFASEIGNGPENTLEFTRVRAAQSGQYRMVVHFANAEFRGGHSYNSQVVDRYAEIGVNGGKPQRVYFRNTFDWSNFQTRVVDIELEAGENTITFSNPGPGAFVPNIARIEIAPEIAS